MAVGEERARVAWLHRVLAEAVAAHRGEQVSRADIHRPINEIAERSGRTSDTLLVWPDARCSCVGQAHPGHPDRIAEVPMTQWHMPLDRPLIQRAAYEFPGGVSHTTVVQLSPERALVYSPGAGLAASHPAAGQVLLIAPSRSHTLGVAEWQQQHPDATLAAAPGADLPGAVSAASLVLPEWVSVHEAPGSSLEELWVRLAVEGAVVWLVCDALTNLPQLAPSWLKRMLQRAYGLRTGPAVGPGFRRSLTDAAAFADWAAAHLAGADMVIPCHGDPIEGEALLAARAQLAALR